MAVRAPKTKREILAAERRSRCVELRKAGHTYEEIAKELGVSNVQAWRDIKKVIKDLNEKTALSAKEVIAIELERLDRMQLSVWPSAIDGNTNAIHAVLKIMERRAKYLGLDTVPVSDQQVAGSAAEFVIIGPEVSRDAKAWTDLVAQYEVIDPPPALTQEPEHSNSE